MGRPTIGVTSYWAHARMNHWATDAVVVAQGYIEGIRLAGGRPLVIPADPHLVDDPGDVVDLLDGMLFVGGDDVAPELYGAERHPSTGLRHELRDAVELALMRHALANDVPVLGICRGIQLMNVAHGGTLHQHIDEHVLMRPTARTTRPMDCTRCRWSRARSSTRSWASAARSIRTTTRASSASATAWS